MGEQSDAPNAAAGLLLHTRHVLPAILLRALSWLGDRLDEPIRLDLLAAAAGVRPRTLEAHFKQYLGTTPLGWMRRMRLARARLGFHGRAGGLASPPSPTRSAPRS